MASDEPKLRVKGDWGTRRDQPSGRATESRAAETRRLRRRSTRCDICLELLGVSENARHSFGLVLGRRLPSVDGPHHLFRTARGSMNDGPFGTRTASQEQRRKLEAKGCE
jgi:hypothetical protein